MVLREGRHPAVAVCPLVFDQGRVLRLPCFFRPRPDKPDFVEPFEAVLREGAPLSGLPLADPPTMPAVDSPTSQAGTLQSPYLARYATRSANMSSHFWLFGSHTTPSLSSCRIRPRSKSPFFFLRRTLMSHIPSARYFAGCNGTQQCPCSFLNAVKAATIASQSRRKTVRRRSTQVKPSPSRRRANSVAIAPDLLSTSDVGHPACERQVRRIVCRDVAVSVLLLERLQLLEPPFPSRTKRDGVGRMPSARLLHGGDRVGFLVCLGGMVSHIADSIVESPEYRRL